MSHVKIINNIRPIYETKETPSEHRPFSLYALTE